VSITPKEHNGLLLALLLVTLVGVGLAFWKAFG